MARKNRKVSNPSGKLAILTPGLGAVSTTLMAGVELVRQGRASPIGSYTQMGMVKLPGDADQRVAVKDLVPLARVDDVVFGAWDIIGEDAAQVAERSGVLSREHLDAVRPFLQTIRPKPGVYDPEFVRRLTPTHVKPKQSHRKNIEALRQDIRDFMFQLGAKRAVMVVTSSVEAFHGTAQCAQSLEALEEALDNNDPEVNPTLLYAYAAIRERVPVANATPNSSVDTPALQELARELGVPIAGRDLKSGQTLLKTVIAPALKVRALGLEGWFSTNILGNRDGEVLDDPAAFRAKEVTKSSVLETILEPDLYPELYAGYTHKVSIHYYPPRGDAKEGWDNIDLTGWLGYPMQIKVNFLCRDSILAAPLVLDIALLLDLSRRAEKRGVQDWMGFYFKSPMALEGNSVVHDLFVQATQVENTLREIAGEAAAPSRTLDGQSDEFFPLALP